MNSEFQTLIAIAIFPWNKVQTVITAFSSIKDFYYNALRTLFEALL